jgi:hypothetical protein
MVMCPIFLPFGFAGIGWWTILLELIYLLERRSRKTDLLLWLPHPKVC